MLRRTLRAILEKAGHTVAEAEDGKQALTMFSANCASALKRDPGNYAPSELISMPKSPGGRGPDRRPAGPRAPII